MPPSIQLPLFPLPNVVHFPRTELRLHVFEPRYRDLIRDLSDLDAERRLIGVVLLHESAEDGQTAVYAAGTAGRLVEIDYLPDGRSNIVLHGDFRFEVEKEVPGKAYRQGMVHRLEEPQIDERSSEIGGLLKQLMSTAIDVAREVGERFPISRELLSTLREESFECVVNSFAAELDVPVLRKLQLLSRPLPERAADVLSILSTRRNVLDGLRPFRQLAASPELN